MAANQIVGVAPSPYRYTDYSIMTFPSWRALEDFAKKIPFSQQAANGNAAFKTYIEDNLRNIANPAFSAYGLFGKHPRSYDEAMKRDKFMYYEQYKAIKKLVEKKIADELQKSSEAEQMKPKLVFNDRGIGEFVFSKAAMSLQPEMYYYSPSKKREVDALTEKITYKGDKMFLDDKSEVVFAFKVDKGTTNMSIEDLGAITKKTKKIEGKIYNLFSTDTNPEKAVSELLLMRYDAVLLKEEVWVRKGENNDRYEFVIIKGDGEESLKEAIKKGILDCTSANKKVYLYKEKKPKTYNAVKIIVGMTAGGFTTWTNDFYTGIATAIVVDVLEGLGYAVDVEVAVGGGRCSACAKKLNFKGRLTHGRRFFTYTAKDFDEPLDLDGLLYTLCDPSFHNIKWISLLNNFFSFFGDEISADGSPAMTWHGIGEEDMLNPIGMYQKHLDNKKGNKNLLHFYIHKVASEAEVIQQITDLILTCENKNLQALKKTANYDFGTD